MKKVIFLSFFICIFLSMTSCSSGKEDKTSTENTVSEAPASSLSRQKGTLGKITVADFSAGWCQPCQMFKPEFAAAGKSLKGKAEFVTVDIDEERDLASAYNIEAVPTVIIFDKEGNPVARKSGYMDAEEVIELAKPYIEEKK